MNNINASLAAEQSKIHWLANIIDAYTEHSVENNMHDKLEILSKYLRQNEIAMNSSPVVQISEELENVRIYQELEGMIYSDYRITYDIQDDEAVVPFYTIQTMVDNAVKHGFKDYEKDNKEIQIKTYETKTSHCIEINDNGKGFDINTIYDNTHVGLKNIEYRLKKLVNGQVTIKSEIDKGTQIKITIPKKRRR